MADKVKLKGTRAVKAVTGGKAAAATEVVKDAGAVANDVKGAATVANVAKADEAVNAVNAVAKSEEVAKVLTTVAKSEEAINTVVQGAKRRACCLKQLPSWGSFQRAPGFLARSPDRWVSVWGLPKW